MRRRLLVILIVLIALVFIDLLWRESHGHFAWSGIPAFYALLGLIGCVVIVLISKWLGHHWLQKKHDYYEEERLDE